MAACSFLARGRDSSPRSVCVRVCSFHALEKREVPRWARGGQNEKGESERKCALLKFRKSIGDDASGAIDAASWIRLRASIVYIVYYFLSYRLFFQRLFFLLYCIILYYMNKIQNINIFDFVKILVKRFNQNIYFLINVNFQQ